MRFAFIGIAFASFLLMYVSDTHAVTAEKKFQWHHYQIGTAPGPVWMSTETQSKSISIGRVHVIPILGNLNITTDYQCRQAIRILQGQRIEDKDGLCIIRLSKLGKYQIFFPLKNQFVPSKAVIMILDIAYQNIKPEKGNSFQKSLIDMAKHIRDMQ